MSEETQMLMAHKLHKLLSLLLVWQR